MFSSYRGNTPEQTRDAWANGVFVVDTNVLLDLYRYGAQLRTDVFSTLGRVKTRVWVPYHVLLEYHENRVTVLLEQDVQFDKVKGIIEKSERDLIAKFENEQLSSRRSMIDCRPFLAELHKITEGFSRAIDLEYTKYPNRLSHDEIRAAIDDLIEDRVTPAPANQADLDGIYKEAKTRYECSVPPGYEDSGKSRTLIHRGLRYERKYGDVLVWKEIISIARLTKAEHVVFITNEKKADWWNVVRGKIIGPRIELIDELNLCSQAKSLTMYSVESFLHNAKEYLDIEIGLESIGEARELQAMQGVPDIDVENMQKAIEKFDAELRGSEKWAGFPRGRSFYRHRYAIRHNGQLYPMKEMISMASGIPTSVFSSGPGAVMKLGDLGFEIVQISDLSDDVAGD